MTEEFRPIKGYEDRYEVSNLGNVKSLTRKVNSRYGTRILNGRILKPGISMGYPVVSLGNKSQSIHRLVASAFIDNPENKPQVNHIDNDRTNNLPSNLEWCTLQENIQHAVNQGRHVHGETMGWSKLEPKDIKEIFERRANGETLKSIGEAVGCSLYNVYMILKRKSWKHVNENGEELKGLEK